MKIEDIITKKDNSFFAKIIRGCLIPFSLIYELIHIIFFIPYTLDIRKKHSFSIPIVSVGNITTGGTGKTPFVITLTNIIKDAGLKPVIISRGYGRKNTNIKNLVFTPHSNLSATDTGDEPQILSKALNVPIIIGKNRIKSMSLVENADLVILDDGMQYWQLEKDIEIGIASMDYPFGGDALIPAGDLRESKKGLKRCAFIILTSNTKDINEASFEKVKKLCPNSLVYHGFTKTDTIIYENKIYNTDFLKGKKIIGFCGIGNPDRFKDTLKSCGAELIEFITFLDHHNYTKEDIEKLKEKNCDLLITTAKDAVKIQDLNVAVLNIYTEINDDFKNNFLHKLYNIIKSKK